MHLGFLVKIWVKKQGEFMFHPAPVSSCFHPPSIVVGCCLEHFFIPPSIRAGSDQHSRRMKPPTSRQATQFLSG